MTPEEALSIEIAHQVVLQKYAGTVARSLTAALRPMEREVLGHMLEARPPRIQGTLAAIAGTMVRAYRDVAADLRDVAQALARQELQFQAALLRDRYGRAERPPVAKIDDAIYQRQYVGRTFPEWADGLGTMAFVRVRDAIRMGAAANESSATIAMRLRDTDDGGALPGNRRHVEGFVRTTLNHAVTVTRTAAFEVNTPQVQWISVLDAITSLTCADLHATIHEHGEGPRPPLHWNCRSQVIGYDPAFPVNVPRFSDWLKFQDEEMQNDILGPTRATLYRDGKLKVTRFLDNNGQVITLENLRDRDAAAFRRAGLH